jgi:D-glycerate 3-kinase
MTVSWSEIVQASRNHALRDELSGKLSAELDDSIRQKGIIDDFYLPLFFHLNHKASNSKSKPCFIGINAPQGGGKTTLTNYLVQLFAWNGKKAVTLSIDDFYHTREKQIQIANENPENPYLQQRGYPGTHDIQLGVETLSTLRSQHRIGPMLLPRYDKSRHAGKGDRADISQWQTITLPVDIVLVEGWMLGFQTLNPDRIQDPNLSQINYLLEQYSAWSSYLDEFIYLCPQDPGYVLDWRIEAEERMKARGLPGMTASDVRDYAQLFLPAYEIYGPVLAERLLPGVSSLRIEIGKNRLPVDNKG